MHRERIAGVVERLGLFVAELVDHALPSPVGETGGQGRGRLTAMAFRRSEPRRGGMPLITPRQQCAVHARVYRLLSSASYGSRLPAFARPREVM